MSFRCVSVDPATGQPLPALAGYGLTSNEWEQVGVATVIVGGTAFVLAMQERERLRRERERAHAAARRAADAAAQAAQQASPVTLPAFDPAAQAAELQVGGTGLGTGTLLLGGALAATYGAATGQWGWVAAGLAAAIFGRGVAA